MFDTITSHSDKTLFIGGLTSRDLHLNDVVSSTRHRRKQSTMSVSGGAVIVGRRNTRHHVENRFYCPPALRKQRQQQEEQEEQELALIENNRPCSSSDNSFSSSLETICEASNLCKFMEHTTPFVPAQYRPMVKLNYDFQFSCFDDQFS